jgi:hypothetical protein
VKPSRRKKLLPARLGVRLDEAATAELRNLYTFSDGLALGGTRIEFGGVVQILIHWDVRDPAGLDFLTPTPGMILLSDLRLRMYFTFAAPTPRDSRS